MSFYEDLAVEIEPLISEYGAEVTLSRITPGQYDPSTRQTAADSTVDIPSTGILKSYRAGAIDGTIVKQGDQMLVLPGTIAQAPEPGDIVTLPSGVWKIPQDSPGAIVKVAPADIPLVYVVRIRK